MSLRRVVFPLPLRPSKTNVSLELTVISSSEISGAVLPLTLYVTSRNSMIGSAVAEEMGASFSGVPLGLELGRTGAYHIASNAPHPN
jgi:hypothetical protein